MKKYWTYLKYVLEHKKNVFFVCVKKGMFIHALTHDLSKLLPIEFVSYAKYFYGSEEDKKNSGFDYGWLHHQRANKHHWDYWVDGNGEAVDMPVKYIKQMLCDWEAMAIKFKDTPLKYYTKNKGSMIFSEKTRLALEKYLSE